MRSILNSVVSRVGALVSGGAATPSGIAAIHSVDGEALVTAHQPGTSGAARIATVGASDRSRHAEDGNTLVEVLIAVMVLGLASVALLIAFSTSIAASAEHRRLATADIVLGSTSQQAIAGIESQLNLFTTCQALSYYQSQVPLTIPSTYSTQFTAQISDVQYWNANSSSFVSSPCTTGVPEEIAVTVTGGGNTYQNHFVVDYPLASSNTVPSAGSPSQLVFTTQPLAGGSPGVPFTTQPVVAIEDGLGNAVTSDLSPVVLSINSGTSGAVLSGCTGNEIAGVVTFSGCTINTAGTYTLLATDGSVTSTVSGSFTVGGTSAPYLVFSTQPRAGVSGAAFSTEPVIKVYLNGSLDTAWSGTISLTASGGVLSSNCATVTVTSGVSSPAPLTCTFQGGYLYDPVSHATLAIPYTLYASGAGLVPATSSTFSVSGAGAATQLVFSTQPSGVANANSSTAFTIQPVVNIEDAYGNVVTSSAATVNLAMSGGGTLSGCSSVRTNGVVTFSGCHGSAYATGVTLTASATGLSSVVSASFNITNVPATLLFTTQPVAGTSGATMTTQPVVTVYDSGGRVVTSSTSSVTLTPSGDGSLQHCTGYTPIKGAATFATCSFAGTVGTSYTLTAMQGSLTVTSAPFSVTGSGVATQLVFTTQPVAGASESLFTTEPVVKVEDSAGNVVTTSSATVSLASSGGTFSSCSNLTAVAGVVNVANCTFAGVVASPYTLTATSSGLTSDISANFSPTAAGAPSQVVLSGCASNVVWNTNCTATATLEDGYANIELAYNSGMTFAQVAGSGAVTGLATVTASGGMAQVTLTGSVVGPVQITASAASLTSNTLTVTVITASQTVSFTSAAPGAATYNGATYLPSAVATSGLTPVITVDTSSLTICSINSGFVSFIGAGTCRLDANQAGDVHFNAAPQVQQSFTVAKASQSVSFTSTAPGSAGVSGATYTPTATATSGLGATITVDATSSSVCSISGGVVSFNTAGNCVLDANQSGNANYNGATQVQQTFTVAKGSQATLTVTSTTATYGTAMTLATSGGSGTGAVTYAAANGTATGCTVNGAGPYTLTSTSAGTCLVTATKATDTNYLVASSAQATVTINKATLTVTAGSQSVTYTASPAVADTSVLTGTVGTDAASITAVTNTYAGTGATVYGPSTTRPTNPGTYSVTPSAATLNFTSGSSANYVSPYTYVAGTLTINKATLTVTAGSRSMTYTGSAPAADTSNLTGTVGTDAASVTSATYTYTGTGATVYGPSTTIPSVAGTYSVTPSAATLNFTSGSSANYVSPYTYVAGTLTINKAIQATLTVTSTTATYGTAMTLATSGGSGTGAVTYAAANGTATGCTVNGAGPYTLTSTSAGTCLVTATKATDTNYLVASSAQATVTIGVAPAFLLTAGSQTLTYTGSPAVADTSSITGGLQYSDAASVTSATYTYAGIGGTVYGPSTTRPTSPGSYSITPSAATVSFSVGAQSSYAGVTYVAGALTINKATLTVTAANQNLTYTASPAVADTSNLTGTVGTDAASVTSVTYTYAGIGATTYGPSTTRPTNAGTYSVTPSAATVSFTSGSSANYTSPYTYVAGALTINKAAQATLTVTSTSGNHAAGLTLTSSGGSGTGAVTYSVVNGTASGCIITGTGPYTLKASSSGTCKVTATNAGDSNYNSATSAQTTVTLS